MKIMKTIVSKSDNTVNWHNLLSKSFHISARNPEKKTKMAQKLPRMGTMNHIRALLTTLTVS